MRRLFQNRILYLSASFLLFLGALPAISIGATRGPDALWWLGLAALVAGALIPPVQRLFFAART